jgi:hypothetical protein
VKDLTQHLQDLAKDLTQYLRDLGKDSTQQERRLFYFLMSLTQEKNFAHDLWV